MLWDPEMLTPQDPAVPKIHLLSTAAVLEEQRVAQPMQHLVLCRIFPSIYSGLLRPHILSTLGLPKTLQNRSSPFVS